MLRRLHALLGKRTAPDIDRAEEALVLQSKAQHLHLKLEEAERRIANLTRELERQRSGEAARLKEAVRGQLEAVLTSIAAPLTQLATQKHLLEAEDKPLQAKDVLAVAGRLLRSLEDDGLVLLGEIGELEAFDPNRHELLAGGVAPTAGQSVVVRFPGVAFLGKVLRKAGVEIADGGLAGGRR